MMMRKLYFAKLGEGRGRKGAFDGPSPSDGGQEPVSPSGIFGQLDKAALSLLVGAEQHGLPLLQSPDHYCL